MSYVKTRLKAVLDFLTSYVKTKLNRILVFHGSYVKARVEGVGNSGKRRIDFVTDLTPPMSPSRYTARGRRKIFC